MYSVVFERIKSGVSIRSDDPTAWKQTEALDDSRVFHVYDNPYSKLHVDCERFPDHPLCRPSDTAKEQPSPWGDSRYRLEKNEITGRYRITQTDKYKTFYNEVCEDHGIMNCARMLWDTGNNQSWLIPDWDGRDLTEHEMIMALDRYRETERKAKEEKEQQERENKAWRPIR